MSGRTSYQLLWLFTIATAQSQLCAIPQENLVVATIPGLELFDPLYVDDCGAMDTEEFAGIESGFYAVHRLAQQMCFLPHVQLHIVAASFDPVDLLHS